MKLSPQLSSSEMARCTVDETSRTDIPTFWRRKSYEGKGRKACPDWNAMATPKVSVGCNNNKSTTPPWPIFVHRFTRDWQPLRVPTRSLTGCRP